jgi:hypothetical protein
MRGPNRSSSAGRTFATIVAGGTLAVLCGVAQPAAAQQLEPRAYSPSPVGTNIIGIADFYSFGNVAMDPSLPIDNVSAKVNALTPYYGRVFGLFGRQASVTLVTPYAWGKVTGDVMEVSRSVTRSGFGDPQLRFAVNLLGGPALTPQEFFKHAAETTLGASLSVVSPYGQYFPDKLINLGANRWAFKPELGLSHPTGKWILELYAGVWLFTDNTDFYGGTVRTQAPLASYQAHVIYSFNRRMWAAFDFTYYNGGATTVGGQHKNDRQDNTRGGLTFVAPLAKRQSIKVAYSSGVTARIGQKFRTVGVAWQYVWFDPAKKPAG